MHSGSSDHLRRMSYMQMMRDIRAAIKVGCWYEVEKASPGGAAAAANITKRIQELGDWRGATLARVRQLIHDADPAIEEEWKWMGTPVWSMTASSCTGES